MTLPPFDAAPAIGSPAGGITDGRARFTLNTAFDDPTSPADAPPREIIEVRALTFFED